MMLKLRGNGVNVLHPAVLKLGCMAHSTAVLVSSVHSVFHFSHRKFRMPYDLPASVPQYYQFTCCSKHHQVRRLFLSVSHRAYCVLQDMQAI